MGHGFHSYVRHNQRVLKIKGDDFQQISYLSLPQDTWIKNSLRFDHWCLKNWCSKHVKTMGCFWRGLRSQTQMGEVQGNSSDKESSNLCSNKAGSPTKPGMKCKNDSFLQCLFNVHPSSLPWHPWCGSRGWRPGHDLWLLHQSQLVCSEMEEIYGIVHESEPDWWKISSGSLTSYDKYPSLRGKSSWNGPLSTAMLDYQRVWVCPKMLAAQSYCHAVAILAGETIITYEIFGYSTFRPNLSLSLYNIYIYVYVYISICIYI